MHLIDLVLALQEPDTTSPEPGGDAGVGGLIVLAVLIAGGLVAYWRVVLKLLAVVVVAIALVGMLVVLGAGSDSGPWHDLIRGSTQQM